MSGGTDPSPGSAGSFLSLRPWIALIAIAIGALAVVALAVFVSSQALKAQRRPNDLRREATGSSLHQLEAEWTTDGGKSLRLADLRGTVRVLALIFTHCPSTCPTLVKDMQAMAARLPASDRDGIRFVLVTIDPDRDTLEALRAYRRRMHLDREHWILLRGDASAVRELAAVLGFGYGKEEAMDFVHSKLVTVLNPAGEIVHQQADVGTDPDRMMGAIAGASIR